MATITTDRKTDLDSDLAATLAHIAAIDAALATGATLSGTKSYAFDSGTGMQRETFNSPMELIETRKNLVATRDYLRRALNGTTIQRQQLRR